MEWYAYWSISWALTALLLTSCEWALTACTKCWATRTSLWWSHPERLPLDTMCWKIEMSRHWSCRMRTYKISLRVKRLTKPFRYTQNAPYLCLIILTWFHERLPTLSEWPAIVRIFFIASASQRETSPAQKPTFIEDVPHKTAFSPPEWPMARVLPPSLIQRTEHTHSSADSSSRSCWMSPLPLSLKFILQSITPTTVVQPRIVLSLAPSAYALTTSLGKKSGKNMKCYVCTTDVDTALVFSTRFEIDTLQSSRY